LDRPYFYYQHRSLRAVRQGQWKLHLPHSRKDRMREGRSWQKHVQSADRPYFDRLTLYNLNDDIGETTNVAKDHPKIVKKLKALLDFMQKDIGNHELRGANARPLNNLGKKDSRYSK